MYIYYWLQTNFLDDREVGVGLLSHNKVLQHQRGLLRTGKVYWSHYTCLARSTNVAVLCACEKSPPDEGLPPLSCPR
jgi:hypothetical protein